MFHLSFESGFNVFIYIPQQLLVLQNILYFTCRFKSMHITYVKYSLMLFLKDSILNRPPTSSVISNSQSVITEVPSLRRNSPSSSSPSSKRNESGKRAEVAIGGVLQKRCSQKFRKIHRKTPGPESLFKVSYQNHYWI